MKCDEKRIEMNINSEGGSDLRRRNGMKVA